MLRDTQARSPAALAQSVLLERRSAVVLCGIDALRLCGGASTCGLGREALPSVTGCPACASCHCKFQRCQCCRRMSPYDHCSSVHLSLCSARPHPTHRGLAAGGAIAGDAGCAPAAPRNVAAAATAAAPKSPSGAPSGRGGAAAELPHWIGWNSTLGALYNERTLFLMQHMTPGGLPLQCRSGGPTCSVQGTRSEYPLCSASARCLSNLSALCHMDGGCSMAGMPLVAELLQPPWQPLTPD